MERTIKRYSAYYPGWCLAFGEHDIRDDLDDRFTWLEGESRVGLILRPDIRKQLFRALLGHHGQVPEVRISATGVRLNELEFGFQGTAEADGAAAFSEFARARESLHMFLTSHFCYPSGTRVVTFTGKKPPIILYKEITPMRLSIADS